MTAKIIIRRKFHTGFQEQVTELLLKYRSRAMNFKGYISGETLTSPDNPNKLTVISTWQSIKAWREWLHSPQRAEFENVLINYQDGETIYEELEVGFPSTEQ